MGRLILALSWLIVSWDDHPDVQDFSEQDRIYALAQAQTGAHEYEEKMLDAEVQRILDKFRKKAKDEKCTDDSNSSDDD